MSTSLAIYSTEQPMICLRSLLSKCDLSVLEVHLLQTGLGASLVPAAELHFRHWRLPWELALAVS